MNLPGPQELVDVLVNGAMLALACMIAYFLWEMRAANEHRRRTARDREIARWIND